VTVIEFWGGSDQMSATVEVGTTRRTAKRRGKRSGRQRPVASTLSYVLLVAVALVFVVPLLWPILRSFEPQSLVTAPPTGRDFTQLTLQNYRLLFGGSVHVLRYALNSAIVALGTVLLTCLLSTLAGMGFGRYHFRGQTVMFLLILATLMIPFQAILTPMFLELHDLNLLDSLLGLIVVYTTFNLPFGLFVMRNSFRQIPREMEESAVADGASTWTILTKVMVPLVIPGMVTVCIYTFLFSWTEFLAALTFLTSQNTFTLPIALLNIESGTFGQVNYSVLEAGAVIAMVPAVVVYLALQRYYVAGFLSGAVKG
jgi:multiple sugar transport system permease protein